MPLTTRCGHCGRLFPVYAQQIKKRRGKVECPQCGGRFKALSGLIDEAMPGEAVKRGGGNGGGRQKPAATAPAALLTFDEPERRPKRSWHALWGLGVLVLIGGLLAQAIWWERGTWLQYPRIRAALEKVCDHLGCESIFPHQVGAIEILHPALSEAPEDQALLRLNLSLINQSDFIQRLPQLQLELYSPGGELAAARRFPPEIYLPTSGPHTGIAPGMAKNVQLDLASPPTSVTGFKLKLY